MHSRKWGQPHAPPAAYEALFTRIVNLVPAPLGLGPAMPLGPRRLHA